MDNCQQLITSGLLELYVLGETTPQENQLIEEMALAHAELRQEIREIELSMERYALENAIEPDPIVKPLLVATIDFMDRTKAGEVFTSPPILSKNSKPEDYAEWINRADMVRPEDADDIFAKILCVSEGLMTTIVWIRQMAPKEVHDHDYERFLILEGTCDIYVEEAAVSLKAGDYFEIPLHKKHHILITSAIPCKAIMQRVAA